MIVDGGEGSRTPPSRTHKSSPAPAARAALRAPWASKAGASPDRLALVDKMGPPIPETKSRTNGWGLTRTATPPSAPLTPSGYRALGSAKTSVTEPGQKTAANSIASGVQVRSLTASVSSTKSSMGFAASRFLSARSFLMTAGVGRPPNPYTVSVGYASKPPSLRWCSTASRVSGARVPSRKSTTLRPVTPSESGGGFFRGGQHQARHLEILRPGDLQIVRRRLDHHHPAS